MTATVVQHDPLVLHLTEIGVPVFTALSGMGATWSCPKPSWPTSTVTGR